MHKAAIGNLVLCCGTLFTFAAEAGPLGGLGEKPLGSTAERHLPVDQPYLPWVRDPDAVAAEQSDRIELRDVVKDELETVKLTGVVPPIRFESGVADIPASTVEELARILEGMRHRLNVRLHLVGHADSQPLSAALEKIYGDNAGLSRERAGQVAEHFQAELDLPAEAISYDWAGDTDPVASNATAEGRAQNRRVEVEVWYDEVRERVAAEEVLVRHEVKRVKVCRMETVCKLRYVDGHAKRARVQNLIAPLTYGPDAIEVSDRFIDSVRQGFDDLADRENVVVRFLGFTDDTPLNGRMERIYGSHEGLAKARARRVALAIQDALDLPTSAVQSDGLGSVQPLGSNATARGRALNRRVEVEFWYDDPLQELPDEPQLCPGDAGAETVTKVYDPPWGEPPVIEFDAGEPSLPPGIAAELERALADVEGKTNVRLRFTGYTQNERLNRRTAMVYGDDIGLSAARARRAMEAVTVDAALSGVDSEFEGRGYVHSDDVVNTGFVQGETSFVRAEVVYDELAVLDRFEGVDVTRMTREVNPENPLALNLMRITVDGNPIDDPRRSSADIQRCTDVALEDADIRFGFDNLTSAPRLGIAATPTSIRIPALPIMDATGIDTPDDGEYMFGESHPRGRDLGLKPGDEDLRGDPVRFRMYTNYSHFMERAEVRVFDKGQSLQSEPLDIVEIGFEDVAEWRPPAGTFTAPTRELVYVLRAYGPDGNFDETLPQPLWLVYDVGSGAGEDAPPDEEALLVAYGENRLAQQNIGLSSGTVQVRGSGIPEGHQVFVAGRPVPVDGKGSFVAEEILPTGTHTVEVAVLDESGNGELFLRDLEFEANDWFYVGLADLTISGNSTRGPMDSLAGMNAPYDRDSAVTGRFAFFVNGQFGDHWKLKASADTREGSFSEIFSNFMQKSPDALFRRIDPDYYYPTFGDDGTVEEMAPTMGKLYLRLSNGDNYGHWGNFNVGYMQNELARVDRGLYGGNLHYQSDLTTSFGETRYEFDAFAAEPGTIPSREEFRGTGGSLYFLKRQDVLPGSERLRVEIRDKASGLVTGVLNLSPSVDYDIDYLQGRVMLTEPLASTVDDNLLVRSGAMSGDEAYLVVRYEYTPGFEDVDALATGGQGHVWLGEFLRLGLTSNLNDQDGADASLHAADVTLRAGPDTWLKLQGGLSDGLVSSTRQSFDGGFGFSSLDQSGYANVDTEAYRADASLSTNDFLTFGDGRLTLYTQDVEAGYSAPGLAVIADTRTAGGTFSMKFGDRVTVGAKVDNLRQESRLETRASEVNLGWRFTQNWDVSLGYREDERIDRSPLVPLTQEQGERTDAVVQLGYDSRGDWNAWVFAQETLETTGDRPSNARIGTGASFKVSERLRVNAEYSDGDLGQGARIGTNYLHSDRTSLYLNYVLENERTDNGLRPTRGSEGNLVAGIKSRLSDSTSVYAEERYRHSGVSTGLTHATGIDLAPTERLNISMNTDIGTLFDSQTGAETERRAAGLRLGYGFESLQISTGVEYRNDESEQTDLSLTERRTWLFRNNLKYELSPSARLLAKFNHAESESSSGSFYDGGFTEAVAGYAFRPVRHDRLNVLAKYTYFYNVPGAEQVTLKNTAAEYIQKSHIASLDVTYDLAANLSVGGKYAHRKSMVSLEREDPEFFANDANLYVLRGDWRFVGDWELLAEGRILEMPDLGERRNGILVALSRWFGDNLKAGVGYNFSEFSDDLTDLGFNHQGVFLNVTGTM